MPYRDFDAARAEYARTTDDPFRFTLGGEDFTVLAEPMFGDVYELYAAPEPSVNESEAVFALVKFIKRLLPVQDRARFDAVLFKIPSSQALVIIELGAAMAQHFTAPFLPPPSKSSPPRRRRTGATSRTNGAGRRAS